MGLERFFGYTPCAGTAAPPPLPASIVSQGFRRFYLLSCRLPFPV